MRVGYGRGGLGVAQTFRTTIASCLALALLASCGKGAGDGKGANNMLPDVQSQLFPDDFKGVCSGASVAKAAAYEPAAKSHKALYFEPYKDDLMDQSSSLPDDWTVSFSEKGDALRAIDLVVCAKRTAAPEVKICDGYKNDGKPTQNKVRWHTATYQLTVHEARTGKTLAETTVEATNSECPMFMSFDNDSEIVDGYAALSDSAVADFLRPHIIH